MTAVVNVLAASVTTFAATNLDDIFLLTVLFARRVPTRRIVAGQFLGFAAIVMVSFALLLGVSVTIPQVWIRILGILPLTIGVRQLVHLHKFKVTAAERVGSFSVLSIAAITFANGADNIGVYVPFFVASRGHLGVGLGHLWAVGPCVVWCWEVAGAPRTRPEIARALGTLDSTTGADRAGWLCSAVYVAAKVTVEQQDLNSTACSRAGLSLFNDASG
jgi:hypothetical protein